MLGARYRVSRVTLLTFHQARKVHSFDKYSSSSIPHTDIRLSVSSRKRAASPDTVGKHAQRPLKRPLQSSFVDPSASKTANGSSRNRPVQDKGKQRAEAEPEPEYDPDRADNSDREAGDARVVNLPGPNHEDGLEDEEQDQKPDIVSPAAAAVTSLSRLQRNYRLPPARKVQHQSGPSTSVILGAGAAKPLNSLGSAKAAVKIEEGEQQQAQTIPVDRAAAAEDTKPSPATSTSTATWAALQKRQKAEEEQQDVLELLSPRKKRRGWVASVSPFPCIF